MAETTRTDPQTGGGPIRVKVGRTVVRVYPRGSERGRKPCFKVADYSTGTRRWRSYPTEKEARDEARRIANLINAGDAAGASMTGDDRAILLRATETVAPFQLDVQTACALFAEAAKLVGAHNVVTVCRAYAKRSPEFRVGLSLPKALEDYLATKTTKGRTERHLGDLRSRLGRFVSDHPGKSLGDFGTPEVQRWLDRLKREDGDLVSPQTRRNFAAVLGGMFEHFRRRGSIAENPCKDLERESVHGEGDIEFWKPEEVEALLLGASPVVLPGLAISLFCGLRTAEVVRLCWRDVDLEQRHVEVKAGSAKTASRRLAPIPANAVEWLLPRRGAPQDLVFPEDVTRFSRRVTEAAEHAGVRRVSNGARHSFVTYRTALTGDIARTASEAGNSPTMIHRHYRGLVVVAEAERFFGIRPPAGSR